MATPALPRSKGYVEVRILDGGYWDVSASLFHSGAEADLIRMYAWPFYLHHPKSGRHVIWDMGMSSEKSDYAPLVTTVLLDKFPPRGPRHALPEQLAQIGVKATDVDTVVFSHAHWDHTRPIRSSFPNAHGYFGPGTKGYCSPGHIKDHRSQFNSAFFDPEAPSETWSELKGPWVPFGSFKHAMDFFGDGSLWFVQAPGHMPGNLFAAAKIEGGSWVILWGDCLHSRVLLNIEVDYASGLPDTASPHVDIEAAKMTMRKLRKMEMDHGLHVALTHDDAWIREGNDEVLMSLVNDELKARLRRSLPANGHY